MVAEHLAKVPLGTLNERRTGDIKTVLNEDIEKLELAGVPAVIFGKALYEGRITLKELLRFL